MTDTLKRDPASTHVAILMGGWSAERDVSLVTGAAIAEACRAVGYRVTEIDAGPDLASVLTEAAPDVVLNALHGPWGEDGCVQGVLECLRLPYTHSGVLASALAMDKQRAKSVFREYGLPVAESVVVDREEAIAGDVLPRPYVVKPINQGSSVGVFVIREGDNRLPEDLTSPDWAFGDQVMLEAFVPGRELTVGVLGDRALGVTEIVPRTQFYDYEAKYAAGGSLHVVPADVPAEIAEAAMAYALDAHRALGCRGATRSDFRFDDTPDGRADGGPGKLVLLEINTQPGMTPTSLLPEQASAAGITFEALVQWMVEDATCPR